MFEINARGWSFDDDEDKSRRRRISMIFLLLFSFPILIIKKFTKDSGKICVHAEIGEC